MADPAMAAAGAQFVFALTTDSADKAETLRAIVARLGLTADVMICPNRGRDVAPFLTACAAHIEGVDLVLHLHTKKSLHDSELAGWGAFLFDNLIGSPDVVCSILHLFDSEETGMVYSGHLRLIATIRSWAYDFPATRDLLARMGISVSADTILEFPTSTMFWARPQVLMPLLALNLSPEDFEPEAAQIDGTLAHAIERCFYYLTEHTGYRAHRVRTFLQGIRRFGRDDQAPPDRLARLSETPRTSPHRQHWPDIPVFSYRNPGSFLSASPLRSRRAGDSVS